VRSIFEAYRQKNDVRVAAIEKRKGDPLLEEKGRAHGCGA
jgi:hypothetical protein